MIQEFNGKCVVGEKRILKHTYIVLIPSQQCPIKTGLKQAQPSKNGGTIVKKPHSHLIMDGMMAMKKQEQDWTLGKKSLQQKLQICVGWKDKCEGPNIAASATTAFAQLSI